jgi:hypothetical protein
MIKKKDVIKNENLNVVLFCPDLGHFSVRKCFFAGVAAPQTDTTGRITEIYN